MHDYVVVWDGTKDGPGGRYLSHQPEAQPSVAAPSRRPKLETLSALALRIDKYLMRCEDVATSPGRLPPKMLTCTSCGARFKRSELWQDIVDRCKACFPRSPRKCRHPRKIKQCARCKEPFNGTASQRYCSLACRRLEMLERKKSRPHWRQRYA